MSIQSIMPSTNLKQVWNMTAFIPIIQNLPPSISLNLQPCFSIDILFAELQPVTIKKAIKRRS